MNWLIFWSNTFRFTWETYQPFTRSMCELILPCHEDWAWQYYRDHRHANDNRRSL